jgi:asparagine synthase (glutamine-hydrolysing)
MCGIAGFLFCSPPPEPDRLARAMAASLRHRGPDDSGVWTDVSAGVALAHTRLAIIDVTATGHQPMSSASGRFTMVFNGEIYNFRKLRCELEGVGMHFRSRSDTEVLLSGFETWGLDATLRKTIGMFALAVWDRERRALTLARDRVGEKPLYFGRIGPLFAFSSELRALRLLPDWTGEIDRDALTAYLRYGYVPTPHCIHVGIRKLPAGTTMTIRPGEEEFAIVPYWSAVDVARSGHATPVDLDDQSAIEELDRLLRCAVSRCMVSDVPLGAFLSGGTDSSTVVALMQAQSRMPAKTFSIGFDETEYDESAHAQTVANHLGTDHTSLRLTARDALAVVPKLPIIFDEPFADVSQIPTFMVSQLARSAVTVVLSGDGGDELFGGYNRYTWGDTLWRRTGRVPRAIRGAVGSLLARVPASRWDKMFSMAQPLLPRSMRQFMPGDRLHKIAMLLNADSANDLYRRMTSHWQQPSQVVLDCRTGGQVIELMNLPGPAARLSERMMLSDLVSYLPDDILVKVDRASMAVGLEARVPLLDYTVVEFAWRLPMRLKIRDGEGKWILKQLLQRYLPQELIERPKMGFAVPVDAWLRGPLRDWAEDLLAPDRLRAEGFFDADVVQKHWVEHVTGRHQWQFMLWNVLMYQAWLREMQPAQVRRA